MTPPHNALRISGALALVFMALQVFLPASAVTYTITLHTNASSYTGSQTIVVTGAVSPAPGPNTGVIIATKDPAGQGVDYGSVAANPTDGSFTYSLVAGGNPQWVTGTFTVNATWGGSGGSATTVVTFTYSPTATSTTTSTTSTITTSSTSTSTSTTSTTTISTTTPAPEFPSAALAAVALVAVAMVAVLSRRVAVTPGGLTGRRGS